MVVRVRVGAGFAITRRKVKNIRIAMMSAASLLTLVAISCGSLGLWRVGADLDLAGDFLFQYGFLSHWQVWVGTAIGVQYASWRLTRYANSGHILASFLKIGAHEETSPEWQLTTDQAAGALT